MKDDLSERQLRVYKVLVELRLKAFLVLVACGILIAFAVKLIVDPNFPVAIAESVLIPTVFRVFAHYFPKA